MSYIEFDINKHTTDLLGLYRYVAAKVHRHHFVGGWAGLEIPRYVIIMYELTLNIKKQAFNKYLVTSESKKQRQSTVV